MLKIEDGLFILFFLHNRVNSFGGKHSEETELGVINTKAIECMALRVPLSKCQLLEKYSLLRVVRQTVLYYSL
ncbi:hypothetical protein ACO1KB_08375 [Leptospira interrogans serovar Szwajizak]|uniref:hypothetical protein n=1 Tax=Leptospira interrogans TaxID=173 RepID=UPI0012FCC1A5|nr:hypothetical protein [Leptospira interrogans]